jgi:hypothetical protein
MTIFLRRITKKTFDPFQYDDASEESVDFEDTFSTSSSDYSPTDDETLSPPLSPIYNADYVVRFLDLFYYLMHCYYYRLKNLAKFLICKNNNKNWKMIFHFSLK